MTAPLGRRGKARVGASCIGVVWLAWQSWFGRATPGRARCGTAGQSWRGSRGLASPGKARPGGAGGDGLGAEWPVLAGRGLARRGSQGKARRVQEGCGAAVMEWHGSAVQVGRVWAGLVAASRGGARQSWKSFRPGVVSSGPRDENTHQSKKESTRNGS